MGIFTPKKLEDLTGIPQFQTHASYEYVIDGFSMIFHYQPSSYWGAPMT